MDETFSLLVHTTQDAGINGGGVGAVLDKDELLSAEACYRHGEWLPALTACQQREERTLQPIAQTFTGALCSCAPVWRA